MASLKETIKLCKEGHVQQAYELAKADMIQQKPWGQLVMGWSLYYLIRNDAETANYPSMISHLDELLTLDKITVSSEPVLYEQILFKVAEFVKANVSATGIDSPSKLSTIFSKLRGYSFGASKGYSFLLQSFIKCDSWQEMADFIDWWDLKKLTIEDYTPFKKDNGQTIMSVAEQAFIAKSKALLRLNDVHRIIDFLPQMEEIVEKQTEMTYPGYFYGKLLLASGSNTNEALNAVIPFAKKKANEFWVWQLLSDVFVNEPDKQLACLIRAVHCNSQEKYLGKVRIKLANVCIQRNLYSLAKHQIDKITECYLSAGWRLPYEVDCWVHQPWISTVVSNDKSPVDYQTITDEILYGDVEKALAVVTYMDQDSHKATIVYGKQKRVVQKLRLRVRSGEVIMVGYIIENGKTRIISSIPSQLNNGMSDFAKEVEGTIQKRADKEFAFLKSKDCDVFISPNIVRKYKIQDGMTVKSLVVYDYNKKKDAWDWTCVNINKKNNQ